MTSLESLTICDASQLSWDELLRIARIDLEIPAQFDPSWRVTEEGCRRRAEDYRTLGARGYLRIAYRESEVVAFHMVHAGPPGIAMIGTLWVHPSLRGQGIARQLKELGVKWAREQGFAFIQTGVHVSNARMLEINRQQGFEIFSYNLRLKL